MSRCLVGRYLWSLYLVSRCLKVGLEAPEAPVPAPAAVQVPVELPTLADLEITVETPVHRAVELQEPQVPAGEQVPAGYQHRWTGTCRC